MNFEDIMLSEISQTERQILYYITDKWNLKANKQRKIKYHELIETEQIVGFQGQEVGEKDEGSKRIQTFSFKMNNFWASNVQYGDYS